MKLSQDQLNELLKRPTVAARNPGLSDGALRSRPTPIVESDIVDVPLAAAPLQAPGKTRFHVGVCSVRVRLIDEDNLSAKYLVDQLRYAGLIADDNPALTTISVTQRKCAKGEPEHVQVTIERL